MRHTLPAALLALTAVACSGSSEDKSKPDRSSPDRGERVVVRIGPVSAEAPRDWKEETPKGSMRAYQFRLPGAEGAGDAELIVFRGIGGTARANVDRWKKQFTPPEGTKAEDALKETEMKVGGYPALYLDARGTYESGMAFGPQGPQKDYRMLGVYIEVPDKPSQIMLRGPAGTVGKYQQQFDDWLKAFK